MNAPKTFIPRRASILGAARSGCAAARFLSERGAQVFLSDNCSPEKLEETLAAQGCAHLPHEAGGHSPRVLESDLLVVSPGVPSGLPVIAEARRRGIAVWSEIELAYRFTQAKFLAVTGSSGKSTTVSMLGSIMEAAGVAHAVAGNIGVALVAVTPRLGPQAWAVAEISSFQLENIDLFRPRVAAVLNLMKNHLDRYENEEDYYNAKKAIARNLTGEDYLVVNAQDARLAPWAQGLRGKTNAIYFGKDMGPADCVWRGGAVLRWRFAGAQGELLGVEKMRVEGRHNYDNACAASAVAMAAGIGHEAIAEGIAKFKGLEHRLEFVAEAGGVRYYNDSKSTTAESIACAVNAFGPNVHLIAGGRDKGCDFTIIRSDVAAHVKSICLIGEAAGRMEGQLAGCAPISRAPSLESALDIVRQQASAGDVVVFSPGCSSFDMFRDFEHRGEAFKQLVRAMAAPEVDAK